MPIGARSTNIPSLHSTMDAAIWAEQFLINNPSCGLSKETLIGWFANAIMTGYDHHRYTTRSYKMSLARSLYSWWNWRHYFPYKGCCDAK